MSLSLQQSVLNRSLELARGADPDYTPIGLHYVGALDLATTHRALHAFRDVETAAWAQAEHCIVRDIVRLLSRDQEALTRWTLAPAPRDAHLLQNKYQLMAFLAKSVHSGAMTNPERSELAGGIS